MNHSNTPSAPAKSAHTPGPWIIGGTPNTPRERPFRSTAWYSIIPEGGPALAVLPDGRRDIQEANARLIAAAPELLAALKLLTCQAANLADIVARTTPIDEAFNLSLSFARAAIAKATGAESSPTSG